jgi:hypothetical protein
MLRVRTWRTGIGAAVHALATGLAVQCATSATPSGANIERDLVAERHRLKISASEFLFASVASGLATLLSDVIRLHLAFLSSPTRRDAFRTATGSDRHFNVFVHSNSTTTSNT